MRRAAIERWSQPWSEERVTVWTVTKSLDRGPLYGETNPRIPRISWTRQLLGDEAVSTVLLSWDATTEEQASVRELFPEAVVEELAKP
jgi:hypothetical protein